MLLALDKIIKLSYFNQIIPTLTPGMSGHDKQPHCPLTQYHLYRTFTLDSVFITTSNQIVKDILSLPCFNTTLQFEVSNSFPV